MVRLKAVKDQYKRLTAFAISIPYGSIKSKHAREVIAKHKAISIPYGSIKSEMYQAVCDGCGISIPYGSIKS